MYTFHVLLLTIDLSNSLIQLFFQVQDAQAALRLYTMFHQQWEADLIARRLERNSKIIKGQKSIKGTTKNKESVQSKESIIK